MNNVMTQPEKIDHIISKGCEYFGISKDELIIPNKPGCKGHNKLSIPRRIMGYLLSENTILTDEDIGLRLGFRVASTMCKVRKSIRDEISDSAYGYDKTKKIYKELITYIGL